MAPPDRHDPIRFLIRDRDTKFSGPFDEVFRSEGAEVILTPIQAPNANAFAERWVGTVRAECLDWTLVLGRRHLDSVLRAYARHTTTPRDRIDRSTSPRQSGKRSIRRPSFLGGSADETCSAG